MAPQAIGVPTVLALVLAATAGPVGASHDKSQPHCGALVVEVLHGIYEVVDHDGTAWTYEETNGIPGLQREDEACVDWPGAEGDRILAGSSLPPPPSPGLSLGEAGGIVVVGRGDTAVVHAHPDWVCDGAVLTPREDPDPEEGDPAGPAFIVSCEPRFGGEASALAHGACSKPTIKVEVWGHAPGKVWGKARCGIKSGTCTAAAIDPVSSPVTCTDTGGTSHANKMVCKAKVYNVGSLTSWAHYCWKGA